MGCFWGSGARHGTLHKQVSFIQWHVKSSLFQAYFKKSSSLWEKILHWFSLHEMDSQEEHGMQQKMYRSSSLFDIDCKYFVNERYAIKTKSEWQKLSCVLTF